jgi:hypothetical protein
MRITTGRAAECAASEDFCKIFEQEMPALYRLAFLLAADHSQAEGIFVSSLKQCVNGGPVFKEWAETWARRVVIENAIRMVQPVKGAGGSIQEAAWHAGMGTEFEVELVRVLRLASWERFVLVISVLEKLSDHQCAILLACNRMEVAHARERALREIAGLNEARALTEKSWMPSDTQPSMETASR